MVTKEIDQLDDAATARRPVPADRRPRGPRRPAIPVAGVPPALSLAGLHGRPPTWRSLLSRLYRETATEAMLRLDPRVAAGPIALAGADIITILLYLILAQWLLA